MLVQIDALYTGSEEWSFPDKDNRQRMISGTSALFVQPGSASSLKLTLPRDAGLRLQPMTEYTLSIDLRPDGVNQRLYQLRLLAVEAIKTGSVAAVAAVKAAV
jgi:hypothetical protein